MNETSANDIKDLWDCLLSRQEQQIQDAFRELNSAGQASVLVHLERMANEAGWHPEQRESAREAIEALSVGKNTN